jgi:hypothetical protein
MNTNLPEKVLAQTTCCAELVQRGEQQEKQAAARAEAVAKLVPEVLQAALDNDRLDPMQKEAVESALADPVTGHIVALELCRDLCAHRNSSELQELGTPVDGNGQVKRAAVAVGTPVTDYDQTESGQKFREILYGGRQQ